MKIQTKYNIPEKVKTFAEKLGMFKRNAYCTTVEKENGEIQFSTWGMKWISSDTLAIKLLWKESHSHQIINLDLYFTCMGGWCVVWKHRKSSYYAEIDPTDTMVPANNIKRPSLSETNCLFDNNDILSLDPSLKYFVKAMGNKKIHCRELNIYIDYPQCELVLKSPLRELYDNRQIYSLSKSKLKNIVNFYKKHECGENNFISLNNVLGCLKFQCNLDELDKKRANQKIKLYCKKTLKLPDKYIEQTQRYLMKLYFKPNYPIATSDLDEYKDYLSMCKELKRHLTDAPRFPHFFNAAFDDATQQLRLLAQKKYEEEMEKPLLKETARSKIELLIGSIKVKDNFSLYLPNTQKELIKVGKSLNNCVGRMSYGDQVKKGRCLIVVISNGKKQRPIECCEINMKTKKIVQLRGKNNLDSKYHQYCKTLMNNFVKEMSVPA